MLFGLSFAPFVLWFLTTYGIALVITFSRIAAPLRARFPVPVEIEGVIAPDDRVRFGHLLRCPMCVGWWAGLALTTPPLGLGPAVGIVPLWAAFPLDAFAAAAACWIAHVVLNRLGASFL